ncbi:uncharacterized protein LOC129576343 [Sitodiplosis mosellana]|uniref:uncharacterized protein LOC129576343 n=1 Tax=Sitodiplosis mosellana TaxID=263140 RepID=UPI002444895B|nr:uncharacterized protein LOC129576343 [Sitodiplosis mosellana]
MFRINKLLICCTAFVLLLNWSVSGDYIVPPVRELCPCLPRNICPRPYGMSPIDAFYLGTILKCAQDDHVRCCGVSVESVVGGKTITESTTIETSSVAPVVNSESTNELATISSGLDVNEELSESNQSQTTLANEVASEQSNDTIVPTDAIVPRIQVPRKPDIYQIFPSKELEVSNPNDVIVNPKAPFMVVLAEGNVAEQQEESKESNDVASTEETVDFKSIEPPKVNTDATIELKASESKMDDIETPASIEETIESKDTELGVSALNTVETTSVKSDVTETGTTESEAVKVEPIETETQQVETAKSETIEPKTIEPETAEPHVTEPEALEPEALEPKSVEQDEIKSDVVETVTVVPGVVEAASMSTDEVEKVESVTTVKTIEVNEESGTEGTTESKAIESDAVEVNTFEPKSIESGTTESETLAETVEPVAFIVQNKESEEIQPRNIESETVKSDVVESETKQTIEPKALETETAKMDTIEPETVQVLSVEQDEVKEDVVKTEAVEPVVVIDQEKSTESNIEEVTEGTSESKAIELETVKSETIETKVEVTTIASEDEITTSKSSSTETTTIDLEMVEKSMQAMESNVTESETVYPETITSIEQKSIEPESVESNTNQSDVIEPEILKAITNHLTDEIESIDSTPTESTPLEVEAVEKSTEEVPIVITTSEPLLLTTEVVSENVDAAVESEAVESEVYEETTVAKSSENSTENDKTATEKAIVSENTEKIVENETTVKTIDVTEHSSEEKTTGENQVITEKMIEHEVNESVIAITTSNPTTELNELKQLDSSTESLLSRATTESTNESNVITTSVADMDATAPDPLTMEASNVIEVRNNKRRESNYQDQQNETTSVTPLSIPSKININHRMGPHKKPSVESVTPVEVVIAKGIPLQSISTQRPIAKDNTISEPKFTSAHKIPSFKRPVEKEHRNHTMEQEHKNHIMELHSMLSSLAKIPAARPPFGRSKALEELIAYEESLHKPIIGNRRTKSKSKYLTKNTVEAATTTTEVIETSTQTEKSKRKYNRRVPVRTFSVGSMKTATTTTTTTTELPNVSTTARQTFNRRRMYAKTRATNSNESTTVAMDVTTKPNDRLRNDNPKMSLEKRRRLFPTRRRINTVTTTETPTSTSKAAEQPHQLMDEITEKPFNRNQYRTPQHRFKLVTERSTDDDFTQPSEE